MLKPIWGLIYKDFAVNKIMTLYAVIFAVFAICLSLVYAKDYPIVIYAGSFLIYLAGSFLPETAMITDRESRWSIYALTLPTAAGKTVLAKYLIFTAMSVLCFILSVIFVGASSMAFGREYSIYPLIAIFGFIVAFDSVSYAFVFRFGPRRGAAFKFAFVFALPFAALMYLLFGDLTIFGEDGIVDIVKWLIALDLNDIVGTAWVWLLASAALCWTVGYAVSCKGYRLGPEVSTT